MLDTEGFGVKPPDLRTVTDIVERISSHYLISLADLNQRFDRHNAADLAGLVAECHSQGIGALDINRAMTVGWVHSLLGMAHHERVLGMANDNKGLLFTWGSAPDGQVGEINPFLQNGHQQQLQKYSKQFITRL